MKILKVVLFAPWFVKGGNVLPNNYGYWLKSASLNPDFDFIIPTNVNFDKFPKYKNIQYLYMSDEEFWNKLDSLLGFKVVHGYYKTGEYRAVFGILFKDYILECDYWGLTEFDVVYGNLSKFINPYLEKSCEVIGRFDHLRLIKNEDSLRKLPLEDAKDIEHPLQIELAFSKIKCFYFDEQCGMGIRYYQAGIDVIALDNCIADIDQKYKFFSCRGKKGKWGFVWHKGSLIGVSTRGELCEFSYIHLQKRQVLSDNSKPGEVFCIVPNRIINNSNDLKGLKVNTLIYTIVNRIKLYMKMSNEDRELSDLERQIIAETEKYCWEYKLFSEIDRTSVGKIIVGLLTWIRK